MASADIQLTPGEKGVFSKSFSPNLILFWLRVNIVVTNRRIVAKAPNTILGIIPLGYQEHSIPVGSVAGIGASVKVFAGRLIALGLVGLLFLFGALGLYGSGSLFGGTLVFLLAAIFLAGAANAIVCQFAVTNNGGGVTGISVSPLEQGALEEFKTRANEYIYTASSAGTSWNDAYASQSQGFQNQMGYVAQGPSAQQQFNPNAVGNGSYQGYVQQPIQEQQHTPQQGQFPQTGQNPPQGQNQQ